MELGDVMRLFGHKISSLPKLYRLREKVSFCKFADLLEYAIIILNKNSSHFYGRNRIKLNYIKMLFVCNAST